MTPEMIARAFELFREALRRPEGERAGFLAASCGDDAALRAEVESLLAHDRQAGEDFLRPRPRAPRPGPEGITRTIDAGAAVCRAPAGLEIPGYEIARELSRGGQAVVYQALQTSTKRSVAIKLLRGGLGQSRSARRRFEREIELVAQLRHPNIIAIFDSGALADGSRYYVMDYVQGRPLDRYVREQQLSLEDTLRLFTVVCDAVQYAHQKGVIHRDLKPTNILVDANGAPRVLDFGLAKPLSAPVEPQVSVSQEIVGTLPYMSPEQAGGRTEEVDIRTDVYSLGVVLYQLLTGKLPYPVEGRIPEVLRHISETIPTPPSRRWERETGVGRRDTRRLRLGRCPIDSELETIVLRALAKERPRRYQSAGELAADIRHYLAGEPITARCDSPVYVLWKQSRRYLRQTPVAALALLCALLGPGLAASLYFWRQAVLERNAAEAVVSFMREDVFQSLDPEQVGRDVDLRVLLDNASRRIERRFERMPLAEASIRHALGSLYASLGEDGKALAHLADALRLRKAALGERHPAVADTLVSLAHVLESRGRCTEAENHLRQALAIRTERLGKDDPATILSLRELAAFARRQGDLELAAQLVAGLEAPAGGAAAGLAASPGAAQVEQAQARLRDLHETWGPRHPAVAAGLGRLAELLVAEGRPAEARPLLEQCLAIWSEQLGPEHARTRETFRRLEQVCEASGAPAALVPLLAERLDRALADGGNARLLADAAWDVVKRPHRPAELVALATDAARRACELEPANGAYLNTLGAALYRSGDYDAALATLQRSDELNNGHPADVAFLAMARWQQGQREAARAELQRLRAIVEREPWSQDVQSTRLRQEAEELIPR